jgi:hypothetical protein
MSERHEEALSELRDLLYDMRRQAEDVGYGNFCGGDPRDFTPDPECSTEEERANHKAACEAWDRGERTSPPGCGWVTPDMHVMRTPFGLGTYVMRDEQAADWAERLDRCLARLEKP